MVNFSAIKSHFDEQKLPYFTFYPKSQKPVKAVIRHIPHSTTVEDICDGLMNLGFDVIRGKQITTNRRSLVKGTRRTILIIKPEG
jgi:hypothetical protein